MNTPPIHAGFSVQAETDEGWSETGFYLTADQAITRLREMPASHHKRLVAITRILSTPGYKPNRATLLWDGKRVPRWLGAAQDVGTEKFSTDDILVA